MPGEQEGKRFAMVHCEDINTWCAARADERIFRVWPYRKVFTPLEVEKKYIDQSVFEDDVAKYCRIVEVVEFENGRMMFGFLDVVEELMYEHDEISNEPSLTYLMDGEFKMKWYPNDRKKLLEDLGYDIEMNAAQSNDNIQDAQGVTEMHDDETPDLPVSTIRSTGNGRMLLSATDEDTTCFSF